MGELMAKEFEGNERRSKDSQFRRALERKVIIVENDLALVKEQMSEIRHDITQHGVALDVARREILHNTSICQQAKETADEIKLDTKTLVDLAKGVKVADSVVVGGSKRLGILAGAGAAIVGLVTLVSQWFKH